MNLIALVDKVLFILQKMWKIYNEKKLQKEHDDLEASPADWFNSHFDGVSTMSSDDKAKHTNTESK